MPKFEKNPTTKKAATGYSPFTMKMKKYGSGKSPVKGLLGKIMNPASMLPGKMGDIAGKLNPFSKI